MTTETKTKTTPVPVPMPAGDWRRALITSSQPRHVKVTGCQLAHFALTDDDHVVREPTLSVLTECAELPSRAVLDALTLLQRDGWTVQVADPTDPEGERSLTCLTDPTGGDQ